MVVLVALVATACGGGNGDAGTDTAGTDADTATTTTPRVGTGSEGSAPAPDQDPLQGDLATHHVWRTFRYAGEPMNTTWGVTYWRSASIDADLATACVPVPTELRAAIDCP